MRRPTTQSQGVIAPTAAPALAQARSLIKFELSGMEMVSKLVTSSGKSGRVYLPAHWCGKRVKIIRLD